MKKILFFISALLPLLAFGAAGDIKIDVKNSSDTGWISVIFAKQANKYIGTDANGLPVLLNSSGGGGTPGGSSGDLQYNNAGSFGGYTPGAGVAAFLQSPTFANLNTMLTGDDSAGLAANNVFTGVNSFVGSFIRTPATITLTANAGSLVITNAYSNVTVTANSTLTPSAAGAVGQTCAVYATNSGGSSFTLTMDNASTDYVATIPAGQSRWLTYVSNGTDFVLSAGDPASATAAVTSRVQLQNPTTGVYFYDTVTNVANLSRATNLGTFASPNTAAGAITWASPVLNIYTSASGALRTYTLPAAASYTGQALILNVVAGTNHVNLQPASGAALVLAGVLLTADHYVQAATSAPGNYICFISDGTNWTSLGSSGTWADASSP